jgi:hypothetical protein
MLPSFAASAVDTISSSKATLGEIELFEETIEKISPTKRVLILTNDNKAMDKGDFITILYKKQPIARAVTAKIINDKAGIKILKIYSLKLWGAIDSELKVQIFRGDDSGLVALQDKKEDKSGGVIGSEDDLYNDEAILNENLDLEDHDKRKIKTDNLLSFTYGKISAPDIDGETVRYTYWGGSWAYQMWDDLWAEVAIGQSVLRGYPDESLDTTLTGFTIRAKYTFAGPFDIFIKPYGGVLFLTAKSPSAGDGSDTSKGEAALTKEISDVEALEKKGAFIFGVTVLKRLVPGWFARLDLGTDVLNLGITVEF